jgi:hypothetical protein
LSAPGPIHIPIRVALQAPPERPQLEWTWTLTLVLLDWLQSGSLKKIGDPK